MARVLVDLFAEDRAHEEVLKPLLTRIANQEGRQVSVRVRAARGGHARAIEEFRLYQRLLLSQAIDAGTPELVVVAIDGNCTSWKKKQDEIRAVTCARAMPSPPCRRTDRPRRAVTGSRCAARR